ncbi:MULTISPECIES: hypothetical protein [Proteus]|uniref:Uncharacterized protein n=2 Tax=Morganellaceae TaxID=1903414 RepID=Q8KK67_PROVU|nr:hypothetical protein [Proteus vulgaris]BAB93646.1 hypothetical protein [Proteus vulgaris]
MKPSGCLLSSQATPVTVGKTTILQNSSSMSGKGTQHPLFEYLEKDATAEQLYLFLKSDSALNLIFFDLVSHTLIGAMPETRGTISENIWDEIGHGDNYFTHVNLYN